ncbi:MAG: CDP-diacylglycerol--serine O-phosphatidyltransferase [Pseudomonadota bacterium]
MNDMKRRRKGNRKGVAILPNLFTSANLFCGFYSIIASVKGDFYPAAVAILVALVMDGLDGKVARFTRTSSRFGVEYDSLADLVSFGVAPAMLAFMWALMPVGRLGWLAAFLFVACGALRLARFNTQVDTVDKGRFVGLPIPAAAAVVATGVILAGDYDLAIEPQIPVLAALYGLSFLMVSTIPYQSFKSYDPLKRRPFNTLVAALLILVVVAMEPHLMMFLLLACYVVSGPLLLVVRRPAEAKKDRELRQV